MLSQRDQRALYERLVEKHGKAIGDAFLRALENAVASVTLAQLEDAINRNDLRALEMLLRMDQGSLFPVSEAVRTAFIEGGLSAATISSGQFGFDGRHYRAESWVREHAGSLVQGIETDTLEMIRQVMENRVRTGESGAKTARAIVGTINRVTGRREGGFLGLTAQQTEAAIRAREELEALDSSYFTRKLRDRRFDALVKKAIESGKPLAAADVDKVTMRYRDRLAKYRSEVIARTEAHRAIAAGQWEGMVQASEAGAAIVKRWVHGLSREPRLQHLSLAQAPSRPLLQPFTLAVGNAMYPHDPALPASETIGCKCSIYYRVL